MRSVALSFLVAINDGLRHLVYRSKLVTRAVYGVWLIPKADISFWELPTLLVRWHLARYLRSGMRVLEVGTGPYAVLALWVRRRWGLEVTATELHLPLVEWARTSARNNGLDISLHCTDLMSGIEGRYDVVWFVPPFIAADIVEEEIARRYPHDPDTAALFRTRSCGGLHGWEILDRFYQQTRARLCEGGRVFVPINVMRQDIRLVRSIAETHGFSIIEQAHLYPLPYALLIATSSPDQHC